MATYTNSVSFTDEYADADNILIYGLDENDQESAKNTSLSGTITFNVTLSAGSANSTHIYLLSVCKSASSDEGINIEIDDSLEYIDADTGLSVGGIDGSKFITDDDPTGASCSWTITNYSLYSSVFAMFGEIPQSFYIQLTDADTLTILKTIKCTTKGVSAPTLVSSSSSIKVSESEGNSYYTNYSGMLVTVGAELDTSVDCGYSMISAIDIHVSVSVKNSNKRYRVRTSNSNISATLSVIADDIAKTVSSDKFPITCSIYADAVFGNLDVDEKNTTTIRIAATDEITIYNAIVPVITILNATRVSSSDSTAEDNDGTYAYIKASAIFSDYVNIKKFYIYYKKHSATSYTTAKTVTSYSDAVSVWFAADADAPYDVKIVATDTYQTTTLIRTIPSVFSLMHWAASGRGMGFGKVVSSDSDFEGFEFGLPARFYDGIYVENTSLFDILYPVGSIYLSMTASTTPFTFGTWTLIAQGKTLIGVNTSDSSFSTAGKTGGSKTVTPSGTVGEHTLTVDELPSHSHPVNRTWMTLKYTSGSASSKFGIVSGSNQEQGWYTTNAGGGGAHDHDFTGNSHTNLPPYITCYIWKRTA